jgi:GH15 family glucan-1,4-alpha-glucosidase
MRIEDYGFLSDTESAALVGLDGSIDWLCLPRFDSGAFFARLLGGHDNGYWQIAPKDAVTRTRRRYRGDTLILETEFETADGCVRLIDSMPLRDEFPDVVRIVEGVRGCVEMEMTLVIRFDYGRILPWVQHENGGIIATAGPDALILRSDVKTHGRGFTTVAEFSVAAGDSKAFVLTWFPSHKEPPAAVKSAVSLRRTEEFWTEWAARAKPAEEWRDAVVRSLVVLKGLTFAPTGGIVAAATTSLPESLGGTRNWDYRYCWLRDATFTLYSLLDAGYTEEAAAWRNWLLRAIAGSPAQMQILYGAAGERTLLEYELPHLAGYEHSRPVRIGNAASEQFQLDVYGEVLDAMHQARRAGLEPNASAWQLERQLVKYVIGHWSDPDEGIWEVRGPRRNFTHSKMMAWVAMDRAVKAVEKFGLKGDAIAWRKVRDQIHREVCARGFNEKKGAFVQYFDGDQLDASLLLMPLVGFLPPTDPRVRSTIDAIQRELCVDGFVLRYRPENSADGLPPGEGAFLPCSFWLVDCLNATGRRDEARELFERLLSLRNDLGLIAEEYDPREKRQVGNVPQAFTHVALVNSASNLGKSHGPAHQRSKNGNHAAPKSEKESG